ncbi:MAG: ABC transporter permease [Armatimonadetes bacterium]|nr:ABC transporter permease [Armatimonadota bacterium]
MGFLQSFLVALNMLRLHKLRAFLTMLGVIIGVMSVTLIVMLSEGFKTYLADQFSKIGSDTIYLTFNRRELQRGDTSGGVEQLTMSDKQYVLDRCNMIQIASGYREAGNRTVRAGETELKDVKARAVDAGFFELNRVPLLRGRLINDKDNESVNSVAVVSESAGKKLFKGTDPIGKTVIMDGLTVEIVGISEKLELMGERSDDLIFVPLSTANKKWLGGDQVDLILMRAKPGAKVAEALEQVWQALMTKTGNRPIYSVESSENVLKIFQGIIGGAGMVLAGIAALSLLVGGIGIMNIMLVSVTERTREIGLRKAVGAKFGAILTQFLIEAATLSLVGGLIGMGIAYLLGLVITSVTAGMQIPDKNGWQTAFPMGAAIMASGFSAAIGMVFGFFPAMTAAKLDPIVALRTE